MIKVTLIEPEADEVTRLRAILQSGSVPAELHDAIGTKSLDPEGCDALLVGLKGVGAAETELLTRLKQRFPRVPLIVLSGGNTEGWSAEAVRLGAQHVLDKASLTAEKLSSTLRYHLQYAAAAAIK